MLVLDLTTILLTTTASFIVAIATLWLTLRTINGKTKSTYDLMLESNEETAFLFDNDVLIDATQNARQLLGVKPENVNDWQWFISALRTRFSTLEDDLCALGDAGTLTIIPDDKADTSRMYAEWWNGLARLVLKNTDDTSKPTIDSIGLAALESELDILRHTAKLAPYLVWQETRSGQIDWANAAYLTLAKSIHPENHNNSWPPKRLFRHPAVVHNGINPKTVRVSIDNKTINETLWFDLSCKQVNDSMLCFATPANEIVCAEASLKGFVQTLTKTFAHLSIGLAVFDKDRELALFNPALTDLTKLPFDFLSAKPTFYAFIDRLRESQMMPEPKDYKNWRHQITALEEAAADGTYEETWALPSGHTYKVIGRPHADGAVALLFEDISAEISLTRNFREELEMSQSVLDALPDAVVVFSSSGLITISNSAYANLWGVDPSTAFGEMSIIDATRLWNDICDPTSLWDELRDFVGDPNTRETWSGSATLDTGQRIDCQFTPLAGGATMAMFQARKMPQKRKAARKKPVDA